MRFPPLRGGVVVFSFKVQGGYQRFLKTFLSLSKFFYFILVYCFLVTESARAPSLFFFAAERRRTPFYPRRCGNPPNPAHLCRREEAVFHFLITQRYRRCKAASLFFKACIFYLTPYYFFFIFCIFFSFKSSFFRREAAAIPFFPTKKRGPQISQSHLCSCEAAASISSY